ncbi:hypothetical protein [Methylophilus sp. 5]|uniref:hypothetical protein n=1 Tax=Methylophilus sp. 5 TaxID=1112274 RepID=UPI00048AA41B|nr:hypothetical protein [Methylophilus sp. 5]
MSHSADQWQQLTHEWADALKQAKLSQAVIDDKMHSFLKGNGCLPSEAELKNVEQLWQRHVVARNKTNQFIQAVLKSYATSDTAADTPSRI